MTPLKITLIQTSLHWEDKLANLNMLEQKINSLRESTHVVLLPEMFSTGFSMRPEVLSETMEGESVSWMKKMAESKKLILGGSLILQDKENFYNRFIWMLPNGQQGYYDKRHLFAYAEEDRHYSAGKERKIARVNGWRLNLMVCYDLRFPVWARQQGSEENAFEYDVLVYVANWPERRSTAWKSLLQARAIENQCYVIGLNRVGKDGNDIYYSGDSMVIDPLGEILYHKAHDEDVYTITLDYNHLASVREKFPFWKDADRFMLLE